MYSTSPKLNAELRYCGVEILTVVLHSGVQAGKNQSNSICLIKVPDVYP